jgi:hypothetical protein
MHAYNVYLEEETREWHIMDKILERPLRIGTGKRTTELLEEMLEMHVLQWERAETTELADQKVGGLSARRFYADRNITLEDKRIAQTTIQRNTRYKQIHGSYGYLSKLATDRAKRYEQEQKQDAGQKIA